MIQPVEFYLVLLIDEAYVLYFIAVVGFGRVHELRILVRIYYKVIILRRLLILAHLPDVSGELLPFSLLPHLLEMLLIFFKVLLDNAFELRLLHYLLLVILLVLLVLIIVVFFVVG